MPSSTQTDLYAPAFAATKSVVDLDGHSPARPGDTLQYSLAFENSGLDAAESAVLRDPIPAGTAYVPGSITISSGANAGPKTDVAGDDQAEFDSTNNQVVARLGSGANASKGGTLHPGDSTSLSFDVKVLPEAAGTTVTNQGFLDYTAATLDKSFTYDTNVVYTPVPAAADLSITKSASSTTAAPGADLVYTLRAENHGPGTGGGRNCVGHAAGRDHLCVGHHHGRQLYRVRLPRPGHGDVLAGRHGIGGHADHYADREAGLGLCREFGQQYRHDQFG